MSCASVMVYVDTGDSNMARIRLACDLAKAFDARLIGVSVSAPQMPVAPPVRSVVVTIPDVDVPLDRAEGDLRCAEGIFYRVAEPHGCRLEWRSSIDDPNDFVADQMRAADILIVGRASYDVWSHHAIDPAGLICRAGRPVLVVPMEIAFSPLATHAVVAWKDCREARRAIRDALPLLTRSSQVSVIHVAGDERQMAALQEVGDVESFLMHHRIKSEAVVVKDDGRSVAKQVMDFARKKRAGLVVMGGRWHARLHDWVIGGETSEMLKKCSTCLLLSN